MCVLLLMLLLLLVVVVVVCVCVCTQWSAVPMEGKEAVGFLELALHLVGSCLMEVLGTELPSSGRASNAVTTESSFYPLLFVFNQINPIVNYHCLSVKMVKIKTVTHQTLAKVHSD